jgi:NitT/TauT family transport system permease protein
MRTIQPLPLDERAAPRMLRPTVFWRIREDIPLSLAWLLSAGSLVLLLLAWLLVTALGIVPPLFLPSPAAVLGAFGRLLGEGLLLNDVVASMLRVLAGFGLAALVSIPLGLLMGAFASFHNLFNPTIGTLRYMPASAFVPLLILWLGIDEAPKIALIFIGTLFFNTIMVADAVKFVPRSLIDVAYTLGTSRPRVLREVIWPAAMPAVLDALRVNMAASWNLVIIAELVAATSGLGYRILRAQRFLRTEEIFVGLIVIGLIGLLIDLLFFALQRRLCPWVQRGGE